MSSLSMDELVATYADWRNGYSRPLGIVRSVTSWLCLLSASVLMWILCRSHVRLSSTFHRLLFGLCASHVVFSLAGAHFNLMARYMVWNARGNVYTCTAIGFIDRVGNYGTLLYCCTLNIYFMILVVTDKSDEFIRKWVEPFLHGIPICVSVASAFLSLSGDNFNDDLLGNCWFYRYDPPHCEGYERGTIRDGFEIPCGRGEQSGESVQLVLLVVSLCVPIVIIVSLGIMYISVRRLESKVARHGCNESDELLSSIKSRRSLSRGVMKRALAYSAAYFLAYGWFIAGCVIFTIQAGNELNDASPWPPWFVFVTEISWSLLAVFDLAVYLYPKFVHAKKSNNLSQAIIIAIWSRGPRGNKMEVITDVVLDAEVELATGGVMRTPIEQDESPSESLEENLHQELPPMQSSIPTATRVPVVNEEENKGDGVENNEEESGGQSHDEGDAGGSNIDTATSLQGIDPTLRSILEERGIVVATLEPKESSDDDFRDNDQKHVEKLHQVTQRLSTIGIIPEP